MRITADEADRRVPAQRFERLGTPMAIATALHTGVLAALAAGNVDEDQLIARLGLDPRAARLLLDVLEVVQLARRTGNEVGPGEALLAIGDAPGGYALTLDMWAHLDVFVRTGRPFAVMDDRDADGRGRAYATLAGDLGRVFERFAGELAELSGLRPRRVLDVACGSGVWGLAFAQRDPATHVTGLDLPAVVHNFRSRAHSLGLDDRIDVIGSDMHEAALPAGAFDLAIVGNVLRLETPERAEQLIAHVAPSIATTGALLVVDALGDDSPQAKLDLALYALHLGMRTASGSVHSAASIETWLARAGLPRVRAITLPDRPGPLGALLATRT